MIEPVGVRRAERRDVAGVAALWAELLEHHAAVDPALRVRAPALARLGAMVMAQLDDPEAGLWVWDEAGRALGFCVARIERAPGALAEAKRATITELAVAPAARRRGIGGALVRAALAWAAERKAARVEVRVAARNADGQRFWRTQGFGDFVDVLDRRL